MSGRWEWWTSNSWRRLIHSDRGKSSPILMPTVHKDGQPDIIVSDEHMALIAAAPELLDFARNVAELDDRLLADVSILKQWRDDARAVIAKMEGL